MTIPLFCHDPCLAAYEGGHQNLPRIRSTVPRYTEISVRPKAVTNQVQAQVVLRSGQTIFLKLCMNLSKESGLIPGMEYQAGPCLRRIPLRWLDSSLLVAHIYLPSGKHTDE